MNDAIGHLIDRFSSDTVEAEDSVGRSEPEKAVGSLLDFVYCAQPILDCPGGMVVILQVMSNGLRLESGQTNQEYCDPRKAHQSRF